MFIDIVKDVCSGRYLIYFMEKGCGDELFIAEPVELKLKKVGNIYAPYGADPATITVSHSQAHGLLESMATSLSELGIDINKTKKVKDELNAVRYHLEDMRTLVFKKGDK